MIGHMFRAKDNAAYTVKAVQYGGNNFEECYRFTAGTLYKEDDQVHLWGYPDGQVSESDWLVQFGKDDLARVSDERFTTLFGAAK